MWERIALNIAVEVLFLINYYITNMMTITIIAIPMLPPQTGTTYSMGWRGGDIGVYYTARANQKKVMFYLHIK